MDEWRVGVGKDNGVVREGDGLVERADGRSGCGPVCKETEVFENLADDGGVGEEGENDHRSRALGTGEGIDVEDAAEQNRPGEPSWVCIDLAGRKPTVTSRAPGE